MTERKIILLLLPFVLFYIVIQAQTGGDFIISLGAAELLAGGENCYNHWLQSAHGHLCYSYSPVFALSLIPLTIFNSPVPEIVWLCLNLVFLYRISNILIRYARFGALPTKYQIAWFLVSAAICIRMLLHNFEMLQMTIFLVWGMLESLELIAKNKKILGSFLLAFVILAKILPIVMLPYLIYRREFKVAGFSILFIFALLFIPGLFLGFDFNLKLLGDWWGVIDPTNIQFTTEENIHGGDEMVSVTSVVSGLFQNLPIPPGAPFNRSVASFDSSTVIFVMNLTRLLLVMMTLYFLRFPAFRSVKNRDYQFWELSYLFLIVPLIFPHQREYSLFFVVVAVSYIVYFCIKLGFGAKNAYPVWKIRAISVVLVISFLLFAFTSTGIVGKELHAVFAYYKLLSWVCLLLLVTLLRCHPKYLTAKA